MPGVQLAEMITLALQGSSACCQGCIIGPMHPAKAASTLRKGYGTCDLFLRVFTGPLVTPSTAYFVKS